LGLEINLGKSIIGTRNCHRGEFAKRLFFNNQNISGLGYQMIQASITDGVSG
jgi:hypothetical protein